MKNKRTDKARYICIIKVSFSELIPEFVGVCVIRINYGDRRVLIEPPDTGPQIYVREEKIKLIPSQE